MGSPSRYSRFFPHSTFSRLRSFTPQPEIKRIMSTSLVPEVAHVSKASASGTSSPTGMMSSSEEHVKQSPTHEVFRWTPLKDLGQHLFTKKAVTMLGSSFGEPTVLAVNGLICIGTDRGYALVFNFKQDLLCICKSELPCESSSISFLSNRKFISPSCYHWRCHCCCVVSRPYVPCGRLWERVYQSF